MDYTYRTKFNTYVVATEEFELSLLSYPSNEDSNAIRADQLRKFAQAYEILFDLLKEYLSRFFKIESNSQQGVIKNFSESKSVYKETYLALCEMSSYYRQLPLIIHNASKSGQVIYDKLNYFYDNMLLTIAYLDFDESAAPFKEREAPFFCYSIS